MKNVAYVAVLCLSLTVLLLCALPLVATAHVNFTHTYELRTALDGTIYRITLPKFVYKGLVQSQRRDLAVFNADGQVVPFAVREPTPRYRSYDQPVRRVPIFELPPASQAESTARPLDVYVRTGEGGHVVSVTSGGRDGARAQRERRYLLDFSSIYYDGAAYDGEVMRRELHLNLPDVEFSVNLSILESNNLSDWSPLLTDVSLIQLKYEEDRLVSDRIILPRTPKSYVQLLVRDVAPSFEIRGAYYFVTVLRSFVQEENAYVEGTAITSAGSIAAVEYDTLGAFPITRVNFALQEPGFHSITYFSRSETESEWRTRGRMYLSMMRGHDGIMRSNAPVSITMREDRYWRIEFESAFHGTPPKMHISWHPGEVLFLTQGRAPYLLAFGSSLGEPSLQNDAFLRSGGAAAPTALHVMEAELGAAVIIDFTPVRVPGDETAEWQRYVVWGLLILGSLMLSGMAWKLIKSTSV